MYRLTRVRPTGEVRTWSTPFADRHEVAEVVARCLHDNRVCSKLEALEFAQRLYDATVGDMVAHRSGYRFYLEQV